MELGKAIVKCNEGILEAPVLFYKIFYYLEELPLVAAHHEAVGKEVHENGGLFRRRSMARQDSDVSGEPTQAIAGDTRDQSQSSRRDRWRDKERSPVSHAKHRIFDVHGIIFHL